MVDSDLYIESYESCSSLTDFDDPESLLSWSIDLDFSLALIWLELSPESKFKDFDDRDYEDEIRVSSISSITISFVPILNTLSILFLSFLPE